ncbi:MAG: hypothetical protein HOP04_13925 [Methylophilaceae bacterium]|nr:hypothetical protein [Methylophilaceae bacterium]
MRQLFSIKNVLLIVALLQSGCVTTQSTVGPNSMIERISAPPATKIPETGDTIGILGVSGSNVFLNGERAQNGALVKVGDTITTGQNSSGLVDFTSGGFFQLDENTDPIFLVKRLSEGVCIFIRIFKGQSFLDKQDFCIESPVLEAISHSQINIIVTTQQSGITVLKGNVAMVRPQPVRVKAGQRIIVHKQDGISLKSLSEPQLADIVRWRNNYTFQGWCCADNKLHSSDRNQCTTGNFSFNKAQLERSCAPRSESPNIRFNLPLPPIRNKPPKMQNPSYTPG